MIEVFFRANLEGCNGAVLKLDFDADSKQVLAASADFAIRTWNIDNFRIKVNFFVFSMENQQQFLY